MPTVAVNLGDIPGRLVDMGRPPLAPRHPNFAAPEPPPKSPRDTSVVDHAVAGDLMLGKKMHTVSRVHTRKRGSHHSAGSVKSRKSCNSDLQVRRLGAHAKIAETQNALFAYPHLPRSVTRLTGHVHGSYAICHLGLQGDSCHLICETA